MADWTKFNGKYELTHTEHFDEYMKALNVGLFLRKLGNTLKPTAVISVADNKVTLKTISTFKNREKTFTLDEDTDETTIDGRKVKTTTTFEDGKIVQRQKATKPNEKDSEIIRELIGENDLVVTLTTMDQQKSVTAKRYYKRVTDGH